MHNTLVGKVMFRRRLCCCVAPLGLSVSLPMVLLMTLSLMIVFGSHRWGEIQRTDLRRFNNADFICIAWNRQKEVAHLPAVPKANLQSVNISDGLLPHGTDRAGK